MNKKLNCIMLVDDDPDDNYFHERAIKENNESISVIIENSGIDAISYLKSSKNDDGTHPDLIFLDINMPCMNGWEFLEEYSKLDKELQSKAIIIMLTTSQNPADKLKAMKWDFVSGYLTKPLDEDTFHDIIEKYFNDHEIPIS